jgi:hypothetical protein
LIRNGYATITDLSIRDVSAVKFPLGVVSSNSAGGSIAGGQWENIQVQAPATGAMWGASGNVPSVVLGPRCPTWTQMDQTPVALQGSFINADPTKVLDGGAVSYATYLYGGVGGSPTRLASGITEAVVDTFQGTAGTLLTAAHSGQITGATWTRHTVFGGAQSSIITAGGLLRCNESSANEYAYASGTPGSANYTVSAIVTVKSLPGVFVGGVCGRLATAAKTCYQADYNTSTGKWELNGYVAGTENLLGSVAQVLTGAASYALALVMNGTTISVMVDGATIISVTDSTVTTAGTAGVMFYTTSGNSDSSGLQLSNFIAG